MKRLFLSVTLCCIFLSFSCTKTNEECSASESLQSATIPIATALSALDDFIQDIGIETKSGEAKTYDISSVSLFGKGQLPTKTKAAAALDNIPDTLIYIVPFKNKEGFALLSANTLLGSDIICVTEQGILTSDDFVKAYDYLVSLRDNTPNAEAQDFLGESDGLSVIPSLLLSSVILQINGLYINHNEILTKTEPTIVSKKGPFVRTKWHQRSPFWDLYGNKVVGCCTIAVCQILVANAYAPWSWQMTFEGKTCNWSDLESVCNYASPFNSGTLDAQDQAAHFVKFVMNSNNLNGTGNTGSSAKAKKVFENFGYSNVKRYWGYTTQAQADVTVSLATGHPVYVDGLKKFSTKGHCWLLDGIVARSENSGIKWYHHINWGWNGAMDGYYSEHNFNVANRSFSDPVIDGNTSSYGVSDYSNYTWDIWYVTYTGGF